MRDAAYAFESLDYLATERRFNAYLAEFFEVAPTRLRRHQHDGAEWIYVLHGNLVVHVGSDEHLLGSGDALYFDSSVAHGYRRNGRRRCAAIVVTSP